MTCFPARSAAATAPSTESGTCKPASWARAATCAALKGRAAASPVSQSHASSGAGLVIVSVYPDALAGMPALLLFAFAGAPVHHVGYLVTDGAAPAASTFANAFPLEIVALAAHGPQLDPADVLQLTGAQRLPAQPFDVGERVMDLGGDDDRRGVRDRHDATGLVDGRPEQVALSLEHRAVREADAHVGQRLVVVVGLGQRQRDLDRRGD